MSRLAFGVQCDARYNEQRLASKKMFGRLNASPQQFGVSRKRIQKRLKIPCRNDAERKDMTAKNHRFDQKLLIVLIILEAVLFSSFFMREVAWYPPDNF